MKVSIILPVINETFSLQQTVDILLSENPDTIGEILIVTAKITTPESNKVISKLKNNHPELIKTHQQTLPFLGGALREAFDLVNYEYTVLMASDLETDPHSVKDLINEAQNGYDIVTCTRWHKTASFKGYNPIKLILNKIFQGIFRLMYRTKLTDLTFAFRIYKTDILKKIKWTELKHPFLFECLIKPMRLGYSIKEIPSNWKTREEGVSQNTFMTNFVYIYTGLKTLLTSKKKILK